MVQKICQSCGMPFKETGQFGTNKDQSQNTEYCCFCFKDGKFTFNGSFEQFVEKQVHIAQKMMNMSEQEARKMASETLPKLKRWKN